MIRVLIMMILAAPVCLLCACSGTDKSAEEASEKGKGAYQRISAEEAKAKMDEGGEYILLDVRTEQEFMEKRIDGAILIPDYEIRERAKSELPDGDALILVYCRSGRRSAVAAQELVELGYTNVLDFGGIMDWTYDTVSG